MVDKDKKEKAKSESDNLKDELASKVASIAELTDHLKRLQAEFENFIKRTDKERSSVMTAASERVLSKFLNTVDDFERALPLLDHASKDIKDGFNMIFKNFQKVLDEEGVKPIDAKGKFNANTQEVVLKVESKEPEDTIIEELQKGYTLNGKVIRYSKVKISRGK